MKKILLVVALLGTVFISDAKCQEDKVDFTADLMAPISNLPQQFQIYDSVLTPESNFYQPYTTTFNIEDSYTLADFEIYVFSKGYTPCPTVELRSSFDINTALKVPEEGDPDPNLFFIFDGVYHVKVELTMRFYYYRYIGPGNNQTRGILPGWMIFKTEAKTLEDLKNLTWTFELLKKYLFGFGAGDLDKVMNEKSFIPDPKTT